VGSRPRCTFDDLYEQCSDHMTAYMASSRSEGSRPSSWVIAVSSSSLRPSVRCRGSVLTATFGAYRRLDLSKCEVAE